MNDSPIPFLNSEALVRIARVSGAGGHCGTCSELVCPGWESMPGGFARSGLRLVGTLRRSGDEEPTLAEHHPAGTHAWSIDAPIAPAFFPYNRCDVWQCVACERSFVRYTEYGGYYEDERIRMLNPDLVDGTSA